MTPTARHRSVRHPVLLVALLPLMLAVTGCYTLLSHPRAPIEPASEPTVVYDWYASHYGPWCDYYVKPWWGHHSYHHGGHGTYYPSSPADSPPEGEGFGRGGRGDDASAGTGGSGGRPGVIAPATPVAPAASTPPPPSATSASSSTSESSSPPTATSSSSTSDKPEPKSTNRGGRR